MCVNLGKKYVYNMNLHKHTHTDADLRGLTE